MSLLQNLVIILTISSLSSLAAPRAVPPAGARIANGLTGETGSKAGLVDCWNALTELRSCTNEIVLFFLNGESYLTLGCCRAIRVITRNCWPAMLDSLGFTSEEADILRGYCDAEVAAPPSSLVPAVPVVPPSGSAAGNAYYMEETVA